MRIERCKCGNYIDIVSDHAPGCEVRAAYGKTELAKTEYREITPEELPQLEDSAVVLDGRGFPWQKFTIGGLPAFVTLGDKDGFSPAYVAQWPPFIVLVESTCAGPVPPRWLRFIYGW